MPLVMQMSGSPTRKLVLRLEQVQAEMLPAIAEAMETVGVWLTNRLSDDAPRGSGGSTLPGDAPGHLANSFVYEVQRAADGAKLTVRTTQPTKLLLVRKGTGLYGPKHQRIVARHLVTQGARVARQGALYWKGAQHPVMSVRGMKKNDFVTPRLKDVRRVAKVGLERAVKDTIELRGRGGRVILP